MQRQDKSKPKTIKTDLSEHEMENLVQITGRRMRGDEALDLLTMRRKIGCTTVTENDVKWAKEEVLRRSPTNDHREIVAQSIWA